MDGLVCGFEPPPSDSRGTHRGAWQKAAGDPPEGVCTPQESTWTPSRPRRIPEPHHLEHLAPPAAERRLGPRRTGSAWKAGLRPSGSCQGWCPGHQAMLRRTVGRALGRRRPAQPGVPEGSGPQGRVHRILWWWNVPAPVGTKERRSSRQLIRDCRAGPSDLAISWSTRARPR